MDTEASVMESPRTELVAMNPQEVLKQVRTIQELMKTVMQDTVHYGTVPGCGPKPTLLKPGAEKLAFMFRLAPLYDVIPHELEGGHFRYEVKCTLQSLLTGQVIAEGIGCCSSKETKYSTVRGEARPNLEDVRNTVEKMAAKRALVAAVLNGTAASDIFTQDIEDLAEGAPGAKPSLSPPQRKSQTNGTGEWRAMASKYKGKCSLCESAIAVGEAIHYNATAKSVRCADCAPRPEGAEPEPGFGG